MEDDRAVASLIAAMLASQDYQFQIARTASQAIIGALSFAPDIMLLDLGLPDSDGVEVIQKVRTWSKMPIIVVSARTEDSDKVSALDMGADDYITKPFSVDELLARLRVALRRIRDDGVRSEEPSVYENGNLRINYVSGCVFIDEVEIHLTPTEYKILCLLSKNTGKVLTHNYITKEVWGSPVVSEVSSLRVYMTMLRKKLERDPSAPHYIQTHIGVGYRMQRIERIYEADSNAKIGEH